MTLLFMYYIILVIKMDLWPFSLFITLKEGVKLLRNEETHLAGYLM